MVAAILSRCKGNTKAERKHTVATYLLDIVPVKFRKPATVCFRFISMMLF
jgi:hypothetical protein